MENRVTSEMLWERLDELAAYPQTEESTEYFMDLLVDGMALDLDILVYGIITEEDGVEYVNPLESDFDITVFGERNPSARCIFCFTDRKYAEGMDNDSEVQEAVPPIIVPGDESQGQQPMLYINKPSCIPANIEYLLDTSFAFGYDEEYINEVRERAEDHPLNGLFSDDYAATDYMLFNVGTERQFVISFEKLAEVVTARMEECEGDAEE